MFNFLKKKEPELNELQKIMPKVVCLLRECEVCHMDSWAFLRIVVYAYTKDIGADKEWGNMVRCRCTSCGNLKFFEIKPDEVVTDIKWPREMK